MALPFHLRQSSFISPWSDFFCFFGLGAFAGRGDGRPASGQDGAAARSARNDALLLGALVEAVVLFSSFD